MKLEQIKKYQNNIQTFTNEYNTIDQKYEFISLSYFIHH